MSTKIVNKGISISSVRKMLTPATVAVASSRTLTSADSGKRLECTAAGISLTLPAGLANFQCKVIPNGTTSIVASGVTLNGAGTTITRLAATAVNAEFSIVPKSTADAYVVTGA